MLNIVEPSEKSEAIDEANTENRYFLKVIIADQSYLVSFDREQ